MTHYFKSKDLIGKNLVKEITAITSHYLRHDVGKDVKYEPYYGYILEGKLEHIAKKNGMKKGNKKP